MFKALSHLMPVGCGCGAERHRASSHGIRCEKRLFAVFYGQSDVDEDSSREPDIFVEVFEVAAEQVALGQRQVLAEDVEIFEHVGGLDYLKSPDSLGPALGLVVAVVHHGYENVEQDDRRQADVEGEDDAEQSQTVVEVGPGLVEEGADAEGGDEHVVDGRTQQGVVGGRVFESQSVQREREPDHRVDEHQDEAQDNVL